MNVGQDCNAKGNIRRRNVASCFCTANPSALTPCHAAQKRVLSPDKSSLLLRDLHGHAYRGVYLFDKMVTMTDEKKPDIIWMEGLLTLYEVAFPHENDDPRKMGFSVGQQIVGLYVVEMLLKYALDSYGSSHGQHHNLHELFRNLPRQKRRAVQRKYTELLNSEQDWAWDVAETVESLLHYLGENAITDTRYFWEPDRNHVGEDASILFAPRMLRPLIYAIFIVLHKYPSKPIVKRYDTTFHSLEESFKRDQQALASDRDTTEGG